MTTTTKKANGKEVETLDAEWKDAAKAATGGDGDAPSWAPQLSSFNEEVRAEKMELLTPGSHADRVLVGKLAIAKAFGENRYFVDTIGPDGKTPKRMALPMHNALTAVLDCIDVEKASKVRLAFQGEAKHARAGERAAYLYDVLVLPKDALLSEARKDALLPTMKENKEKRDAEKKKGKRKGGDADVETDAAS